MGDTTTLKIPSTITSVEVNNEYCYSMTQKCCWKGKTGKECNSNNGNYSGCNRTICNLSAAEEICSKFNYAGKTWRLATNLEAQNWGVMTADLGNNGLMLCNHGTNSTSYSDCTSNHGVCLGAYNTQCYPRHVWLKSTDSNPSYIATVDEGNFSVNAAATIYFAKSVRCVTEMDTE